MKKANWKEKIRYRFDNIMSRGTGSLIVLLFAITAFVVVVAGIVSAIVNGNGTSVSKSMWLSLMHAIDAGTLAGDEGNILFILLMSVVTICGLFITSMLIGIINTGIEGKMASLRKGKSHVLENGHVLLLGFSEASFTILTELMNANANRKDGVIVVMDSMEKEEIEDAIHQRIPDTRTTRVICRSGRIDHFADLQMCSIETCRSVIINAVEDFLTVKTILAASSLLKESNPAAYITAVIQNKSNLQAARIAGDGMAEILYFQSTVARIMAHTTQQPGFSAIFTELFGYGGDEIYVEAIGGLEGRRMGDLNLYFPNSTVMGIFRKGVSMLNPPSDTLVEPEDKLILIAQDDGVSIPGRLMPYDETLFSEGYQQKELPQNILVLGCSPLLDEFLMEEDAYLAPSSKVTVAAEEEQFSDEYLPQREQLRNLTMDVQFCDIYDRAVLERLLQDKPENVLVLTNPQTDDEEADAHTLLLLLLLRDIARSTGEHFTVTSEIRKVENQELARVTRVNDFVISSNLTALMMTQVSQTRELYAIFEDLLDENGSELYMKPAARYVKLGQPVDFYAACASAARYDEVFIGYKKANPSGDGFSVIVNPAKANSETFTAKDCFIVVAEG